MPPLARPLAESHQRRPLATPQGRKSIRVRVWQPSALDIILESISDHPALAHRADDQENHNGSDDTEGDKPQFLKDRHRQNRGEPIKKHVAHYSHNEPRRRSENPHKSTS